MVLAEDERYPILKNVFDNTTPISTAAEKLASLSYNDIDGLWNLITHSALKFPNQQNKLVSILIHISKLPDAKTNDNQPFIINGKQVWKDLPKFGWYLREEMEDVETSSKSNPFFKEDKKLEATSTTYTTSSSPPSQQEQEQLQKQIIISDTTNLHKFMALLMKTKEPVFSSLSWFALIALREALEVSPYASHRMSASGHGSSLDADILAAAAWIEILGVDIYQWDEQFSGRLGRALDLWKGPSLYGFCKERWGFWKVRFGEIAKMQGDDKLGERARNASLEAERRMMDIENGNVKH